MQQDIIASVAGVLISLVCSYVPGVKDIFAALDPTRKRLVVLIALAVASIGIFGASCAGLVSTVACTQEGASAILRAFVVAMVTSQGAYLLSPYKQA